MMSMDMHLVTDNSSLILPENQDTSVDGSTRNESDVNHEELNTNLKIYQLIRHSQGNLLVPIDENGTSGVCTHQRS